MKIETKHIVLSVAGGLVTLVLGYLIWRHEQTVQASTAAAQEADTQSDDQTLEQQLAGELETIPSTSAGGYSSGESDSGVQSAGDSNDSNIAAILAAFMPTSTTSTTSTTGNTVTPVPVGSGNPVKQRVTNNPQFGGTGSGNTVIPQPVGTGNPVGVPTTPVTSPSTPTPLPVTGGPIRVVGGPVQYVPSTGTVYNGNTVTPQPITTPIQIKAAALPRASNKTSVSAS